MSAFDFGPAELAELLVELATVSKAIDIEPRLHQEDEMARVAEGWVKTHEGLTGPTFRIRCQLRSGDKAIERFTGVVSAIGISSQLDRDGWVRLRHERVGVIST